MPRTRRILHSILLASLLSCVWLLPSAVWGQSLLVSNVSLAEGNTGTTDFVFTVTLSPMSGDTVTVDWFTADITTTADDYIPDSGTVTFLPGETSQPVAIQVVGDTHFESSEFFTLNLSNPVNAVILDGQGLGTIQNDDVQVSIDDVSMAEGDSGTTDFIFTISLDASYPLPISVTYETMDSTATEADNDYVPTSGIVDFDPGETEQMVVVQVNGDTAPEPDEFIELTLPTATGADIADAVGVGTILNDDATVSIGDVSVAEGDAGSTAFDFTVSLDVPSAATVMVDFETMDGTATLADGDYAMDSGTATFAPFDTMETVTIQVNGDTAFEPNETFTVVLSNPVNTAIVGGTGVGTILNDDVRITIGNLNQAEGDTGTTEFEFTVSLTPAVPKPTSITVEYSTQDSTATVADSDYVSASGLVTFLPGETSRPLPVQVVGDTDIESNEFFIVNLSNPSGAEIADGQALGTILNDDFTSNLSIDDVTMAEGDAGTTPFEFTITLSPPSAGIVTVGYTTVNGTAQASPPADYVPDFDSVQFDPGETQQMVSIDVVGDLLFENNETFFVNLTSASGAGIEDGQGQGTILNDEDEITISIGDVSVIEGDTGTTSADFMVTLSGLSAFEVTFDYITEDGSASAGADYEPTAGQGTIMPEETATLISVQVVGDLDHEIDETFVVTVDNPQNSTIDDGQGVVTIQNDDTSCSPMPASVTDLTVELISAGTSLQFTWTDAADSDGYVLFEDADRSGQFVTEAAMASSGSPGIVLPAPAGDAYYLLAGENGSCGLGPKRACAHDTCVAGSRLDSACDPCVASICTVDPSCCESSWSASCVAAVAGVCGLTCP